MIFEQVKASPWDQYLPLERRSSSSDRSCSTLHSEPDVQAIKKRLLMLRTVYHRRTRLAETGSVLSARRSASLKDMVDN